jgi:hypothetical protein
MLISTKVPESPTPLTGSIQPSRPPPERGRQAWKSLRSDETFEKWIAIGRAIEIGRNETMRALHRPAGAQWSRVFGAWLAENGFDEIDKGVRLRPRSDISHPHRGDDCGQGRGTRRAAKIR